MSLFDRLLSSASPTTSNNALNSNLEDQFTINLLFPCQDAPDERDQIFPLKSGTTIDHSLVDKFDLNTEFDLQIRDVRVIIMQEATSLSDSAHLLYDSHVSSSIHTEKQDMHRSLKAEMWNLPCSKPKSHTAQKSCPVIIQRNISRPRALSNLDRLPHQCKITSNFETEFQRSRREYREEVATFSNCIFGSSEILAYKSTSTKVHILPSDTRIPTVASSHVVEGSSSFGRADLQGYKLAKSLTSDRDHKPLSTTENYRTKSNNTMTKRKKILITRMFPLPLPKVTNCNNSVSHATESQHENHNAQLKQIRTPMFAVGLVIKFYPTAISPTSRSLVSDFQSSSLLMDQDPSSSIPSTECSSSKKSLYENGPESVSSMNFSRDSSQIDVVAQNWDVIVRTLTHLQTVTIMTLSPMLMRALLDMIGPREFNFQETTPSFPKSVKKATTEAKSNKPPRSSARMIQLAPNCLMFQSGKLGHVVDASRQRIVTGITAKKVVTGQRKWGIWRDQARAVYGWFEKKDQDFMHILLSAFLGNHTGWVLEMSAVRHRPNSCYNNKNNLNKYEKGHLSSRTVIVSDNKFLARRLIFLLSSYLPSNTPNSLPALQRPNTVIPSCAESTSPSSSAIPIYPRDSINCNTKKSSGLDDLEISRTLSNRDKWTNQNQSPERSFVFPILGSHLDTFKSPASIASTATSVTTLPHFFTCRSIKETKSAGSLGNSDSLLSNNLHRLNQTYNTIETCFRSKNLGWENMTSGIYSNSKIAYSCLPKSSIAVPSTTKTKSEGMRSKTVSMSGKGCFLGTRRTSISGLSIPTESSKQNTKTKTIIQDQLRYLPMVTNSDEIVDIIQRPSNPLGSYESPIKTSINKDDGIIDIDVPLPDFLHLENVVDLPSSFDNLSSSEYCCSEHLKHSSHDRPVLNDPINVAGWLPRFSPDFVMQAVPGYSELVEEVKACLRAEPTPPVHHKNADNWINIGSVIIADTQNLTIKRLLYRRMATSQETSADHHLDVFGSCHEYFNPALDNTCRSDKQTRDCFVEEKLCSVEEKLAETVRGLISPTGQAEKSSSESSFKTAQIPENLSNQSNSIFKEFDFHEHKIGVPGNECKCAILTTLEEIVEEVIKTRSKGKIENEESFLRNGVRNWLSVTENNF